MGLLWGFFWEFSPSQAPPPWPGAAASAGAARKKPSSPPSTPPTFYQPDPAGEIPKISQKPPRNLPSPPRIGRGSAASSARTASEKFVLNIFFLLILSFFRGVIFNLIFPLSKEKPRGSFWGWGFLVFGGEKILTSPQNLFFQFFVAFHVGQNFVQASFSFLPSVWGA